MANVTQEDRDYSERIIYRMEANVGAEIVAQLAAELREAKEALALECSHTRTLKELQGDDEEIIRALRAENAELKRAVGELREWVSTTAQHPAFCGANWSKVGSYAADTCTCGKVDILVSTAHLVTNAEQDRKEGEKP